MDLMFSTRFLSSTSASHFKSVTCQKIGFGWLLYFNLVRFFMDKERITVLMHLSNSEKNLRSFKYL